MNPIEAIITILAFPFQAFGQVIQNLPPPPGFPPLPGQSANQANSLNNQDQEFEETRFVRNSQGRLESIQVFKPKQRGLNIGFRAEGDFRGFFNP